MSLPGLVLVGLALGGLGGVGIGLARHIRVQVSGSVKTPIKEPRISSRGV
jgi:hypothetical protein